MAEELTTAPETREERTEPLWDDALFRQHRKHGKYREVPAPEVGGGLVDTHTHVHLTPQPAENMARALVWGIDWLCNVVDVQEDAPDTFDKLEAWRQEAAPIAAAYARQLGKDPEGLANELCLSIIAGCHPHNARFYDDAMEARLEDALRDPRVCAIGEAGLDFHYDFSPRDSQVSAFRRQIRLAQRLDLPLCLHIREAHDLAFRILEEEGWNPAGTVLHCFNLDWEALKPWVERGSYVGFDGPITFKKADDLREAARLVPAELILTETDAPYMTPEPMRGMICGPQHMVFTAAELARVRGCEGAQDREALFAQLRENARRVYGRGPRPWQTGRKADGDEQQAV